MRRAALKLSMPKQKIKPSNSILNSLRRALRPIPFWVGYKREKYWHHDVPEAAIVAELRETLLSSVPSGLHVECEVAYSKIDPQMKRTKPDSHSQLADLAISSTNKRTAKRQYHAAIEVKRGKTKGALKQDIMKLQNLQTRARNQAMQKYAILVTEAAKPSFGITKKGNAIRAPQQTIGDCNVKVRGVFHSLGFLPSLRGESKISRRKPRRCEHWVLLIEVV